MTKIIYFIVLYFFALSGSSLQAQRAPSNLDAGTAFEANISAEDFNELLDYADYPRSENSRKIFDIIKRADPDTILKDIRSTDNLVVFLSIGELNQIAFIREFSRNRVLLRQIYEGFFVEPEATRMPRAEDFFAVWITETSDDFATSVEVDITRLKRARRLTSFESTSSYELAGYAKNSKTINVGVKHIRIPFHPSNVNVAFIRRDLDTYEKRIWSRSYRVSKPRSRFSFVDFTINVFIPFTDPDLERFEIKNNEISVNKIRPTLYFGFSLDVPNRQETLDRNISYFWTLLFTLTPDLIFGVGLPFDIDDLGNNSYICGFSWPLRNDLLKVSLVFQNQQTLLPGFQIGQTIDSTEEAPIVSDSKRVILGLSLSVSYVNRLIRAL